MRGASQTAAWRRGRGREGGGGRGGRRPGERAAMGSGAIDMGVPADKGACEWADLSYQSGFGNTFSSEALPGALPARGNNPRVCAYGLYAEQLSGTAFTMARKDNFKAWLYRIRPSVTHEPFAPAPTPEKLVGDFGKAHLTPNQLRWDPLEVPGPDAPTDFVRGLYSMCGAGSSADKSGYAMHMYACNKSMDDCCLCNADGEFLIVPQQGALRIKSEFGRLRVAPTEICVMPRGVRFAVELEPGASGSTAARGYILEVYSGRFELPNLGPIGANGLAAERDFHAPEAWFEETDERHDMSRGGGGFRVLHKFEGQLFEARQPFSPFNVVAWHGNYYPYKYDLSKFCPVNAVMFDHPDPSIFTVLTVPSATPGTAVADFVIFPPRWSVSVATFRPPYYHRNAMNEFMGLIRGEYEAKEAGKGGFQPGGASLHMCMTPHGPDTTSFETEVARGRGGDNQDPPHRLPDDTLAFMFEVNATPRIAPHALSADHRDADYYKCWQGLRSHFDRNAAGADVPAAKRAKTTK